uniref:MYM-type domain-containing protein n=1 Tax=viral metagenome TaxID=1070528 RepID=A0A6C0CM15_9ZZZZ
MKSKIKLDDDEDECVNVSISSNTNKQHLYTDLLTKDNKQHCKIRIPLFTDFCTINTDKEMPSKSDYACLWCGLKFDNSPFFLPTAYNNRKDLFHITGNFCMPACVIAYNQNCPDSISNKRSGIISMYHKRLFGKYIPIKPALNRQFLKYYGGYMEIEEYRKTFLDTDTEYRYTGINVLYLFPIVEEIQTIDYIKLNNKNYTEYNENNEKITLKEFNKQMKTHASKTKKKLSKMEAFLVSG